MLFDIALQDVVYTNTLVNLKYLNDWFLMREDFTRFLWEF